MQNADCGLRKSHFASSRCAPTFPLPPSAFPLRLGVTLIELLIAIAIIAILATAFLGASRAAMEHARASRTRTTINKIHTLLMEQWASYETRRVDIRQSILDEIENRYRTNQINDIQRGQELARVRLNATRELMLLEMPDRWSDITNVASPGTPRLPMYLESVPSLTRAYLRRFNTSNPTEVFESAECLHMVIMLACGDGEARTLFSPQDIGDVDGDGAPEFLDGWGSPIRFIRWPAGFAPTSSLMTGDPTSDPDPFDHFRVDVDPTVPRGYRLVPLVYSFGPDGQGGIVTNPGETRPLDPYARTLDGLLIGAPGGEGGVPTTDHIDNIHNHLIGGR